MVVRSSRGAAAGRVAGSVEPASVGSDSTGSSSRRAGALGAAATPAGVVRRLTPAGRDRRRSSPRRRAPTGRGPCAAAGRRRTAGAGLEADRGDRPGRAGRRSSVASAEPTGISARSPVHLGAVRWSGRPPTALRPARRRPRRPTRRARIAVEVGHQPVDGQLEVVAGRQQAQVGGLLALADGLGSLGGLGGDLIGPSAGFVLGPLEPGGRLALGPGLAAATCSSARVRAWCGRSSWRSASMRDLVGVGLGPGAQRLGLGRARATGSSAGRVARARTAWASALGRLAQRRSASHLGAGPQRRRRGPRPRRARPRRCRGRCAGWRRSPGPCDRTRRRRPWRAPGCASASAISAQEPVDRLAVVAVLGQTEAPRLDLVGSQWHCDCTSSGVAIPMRPRP